ncbi:MAG TPA: hypothetical protein VFC82_08810 [Actinomycetaceae bacterium]|nr:hypothetical protein [Actinomycetaceae bacterium]
MDRKPRGDTSVASETFAAAHEWLEVLKHRSFDDAATVNEVIERFERAGVTPGVVAEHLADGGDALYTAARDGEGWTDAFGGDQAVALIAAEVSALMSHLVSRAASVRSRSVDALLDDFSAVTVASALGVSRQKVYDIAKSTHDRKYLETTPWRQQ